MTVNPAFPSFRRWQETRLPEPYRSLASTRWVLRDWRVAKPVVIEGLAALRGAILDMGRALVPVAKEFAEFSKNLDRSPGGSRTGTPSTRG